MSAWVLVAIFACSAAPCTNGHAIAAYGSEQRCNAALSGYDAKIVAERRMACVELDPGTMEVLKSMR
jgi:hypothetical protein